MDQHFYRLAQGLRLSSLGIGTYLGRADDETDRAYEGALRTAIEGGINVLDTSRNYRGERSELAIGRVLQDFDREKLVLCTKAGYYLDRNAHSLEPEFLEENLRLSLVNLGVAEVDIFYLHNPETQLRERGEEAFYDIARAAFERCEALVAQGLTR